MTMPQSNISLKEDSNNLSDELNLYFKNKFGSSDKLPTSFIDEPYINSWKGYCIESTKDGVFQTLKNCYPQLNFPIESGIDKTQDYVDAVLKGKTENINLRNDLKLNNPEDLKIKLHVSIAGTVPVLQIPDSHDFIKIVQCLLHKNNPTFVPLSMGACLINGINNWDRLHTLKNNWSDKNSIGNWNEEFLKNVLPNPNLFKDKIIILSTKPYSNVAANSLGLSDVEWKTYSYSIRLEHECTHLYTLKKYGFATNNLHDELIADYIGISKTFGSYNKEWMLTFMGLEEYPKYRKGARLENYLGNTDLSFDNFEKLIVVIKNAIETIALFDNQLGKINSDKDQMCRIDALCEINVLEIASENGSNLLVEKYNKIWKSQISIKPEPLNFINYQEQYIL
jgi:FtsZ-binding cell division protein ZapB